MCGGGGIVQKLDQANANFHPLKGIVDQPVIDPILQGDMTVKGDVVPGSYVDKKNQNLGLTDAQQMAGFFSKAIAGAFGGHAASGALGAGAGSEVVAGENSADMLIGSGGGEPTYFDIGAEEASGGTGATTLHQSGVPVTAGPNSDPNQDPNAAPTGTEQAGFLDATVPTAMLDPSTAQALGITSSPQAGGLDASFSNSVGVPPGGMGGPPAGADYSAYTGETPTDMLDPVPDQTIRPEDVAGGKTPGTLDSINAALRKVGLSPATAGLLGISGIQALSKPKTPQASRTLEGSATAGSAQANSVLQSGGQSSPAWQSQKTSIDATIDQQLQQQTQAILQQAQNSGQGADSQVTIQQINKLKTQLETQRQTLYAQAQGQNVQAALQQLGISDQALSGVAAAQYKASQDARNSAGQTAQMALMLQALSRGGGGGASAGILPNGGQPTA